MLDQLVVGAELVQEPVLDDRDAVGVVRSVEPVGDRHHGTARQHRGERALEMTGRARVLADVASSRTSVCGSASTSRASASCV